MSEIYETGARGVRMLAQYLSDRGRQVEASDRKTFDLIVDGKYAEVKSSNAPYARLGFIGLTDAQYRALREGIDFRIFVVCNAASADSLEVMEFDAADLLAEEPKVECTYYWYRAQLERCRRPEAHATLPPRKAPSPAQLDEPDDAVFEKKRIASARGSIMSRIRRLARSDDAHLYVAFGRAELDRANLADEQKVEIDLNGRATLVGTIKTSGGSPWLSPRPNTSNAAIDQILRSAGFQNGDEVPSSFRIL